MNVINFEKRGRGIWKFNNAFFKDVNYTVRDHNTINEEDLKHVGNIKDLLSMRVFKHGFTAGKINAMLNFVCTT